MKETTKTRKRLFTLVTLIMLCMSTMVAYAAEWKEVTSIKIEVDTTGDLSLPEITTTSKKYEIVDITWKNKTEELKAGQELKAEVKISPTDGYKIVIPKKEFKDRIRVTGADYVQTNRNDDFYIVTIKYTIRGELSEPEKVYWDEKEPWKARCSKVEQAKEYEFYLYRENSSGSRTKITSARTTNTYYNFAKDLAKYYSNRNRYDFYFKVRVIAKNNYADNSEYIECEEAFDDWYKLWDYCDRNDISTESSNQKNEDDYTKPSYGKKTGWRYENGWYYYNDDGTKKIGWLSYDGRWYYLKSSKKEKENGAMHTGWLWDNGYWYYCTPYGINDFPEGSALYGFRTINGRTYYLNPTDYEKPNTPPQASCAKGWWNINGSHYYFYPHEEYNGWNVKECEMARDVIIEGHYIDRNGRSDW